MGEHEGLTDRPLSPLEEERAGELLRLCREYAAKHGNGHPGLGATDEIAAKAVLRVWQALGRRPETNGAEGEQDRQELRWLARAAVKRTISRLSHQPPVLDTPVEMPPPTQTPPTLPRSVQIIDELVAEYRELVKRYPQPNLRDVFADSRWVDEVFASGVFEPYRRKYIAVADRQVRGTGDTDIATRVAAAKAHHLHPDRFWVTYIESPDDFFYDPADH